jgi:hypothetical protein
LAFFASQSFCFWALARLAPAAAFNSPRARIPAVFFVSVFFFAALTGVMLRFSIMERSPACPIFLGDHTFLGALALVDARTLGWSWLRVPSMVDC